MDVRTVRILVRAAAGRLVFGVGGVGKVSREHTQYTKLALTLNHSNLYSGGGKE